MTEQLKPNFSSNTYFQRLERLYQEFSEIISSPSVPEYPVSHLIETFDKIHILRDWFLDNNPNPQDCLAITQIISQLSQPKDRRSKYIVKPVSTVVKSFFENSLDLLDPVIIPKVFHHTYN